MRNEIDVVDIGGGNLGSLTRCLTSLGASWNIVCNTNPPHGKRPIILPGVGAFGAVMNHLRKGELNETLCNIVQTGTPLLGICVGLQVLFDTSQEAPGMKGLGLIPGKVTRFTNGKIPQIGWNQIYAKNDPSWDSGYVYFVNSFYAVPESAGDVLYTANYYGPFCAAIKRGNITAFQFHPEKSGEFGKQLLNRWISSTTEIQKQMQGQQGYDIR